MSRKDRAPKVHAGDSKKLQAIVQARRDSPGGRLNVAIEKKKPYQPTDKKGKKK